MKIHTLTLNPAYDVHCAARSLAVGRENFVSVLSRCAGGKGVNISKALSAAGASNKAYIVLGEENSYEFESSLDSCIAERCVAKVAGRIRENITVHSESGEETRISFGGFSVGEEIFSDLCRELFLSIESGDFLTLTGSLPKGVSVKDGIKLIKEARALGVRTVLDSRSFTLSDIAEAKPYLIKPNEEEIEAYLGKRPATLSQAAECAKALLESGCECAMVSLGAMGAVLASDEGVFAVSAPEVKVLSTIGAGDSGIAGFLYAKSLGCTAPDCLRYAVAFGSAACMESGTDAPRADAIKELFAKTEVCRIG